MAKKTENAGNICNADRSQRTACVFYNEKTGRCSQGSTTWQEAARAKR